MSNVRVLHIGKYYPPAPGGMESYLGDLCPAQARLGARVLVLCHRADRDEPAAESPAPGVEVLRLPVALTAFFAPVAPLFPLALSRAIRRFRPDVIHVHVPNLSALWAPLVARGLPVVVHWHSDVTFPAQKPLHRALYRAYAVFERALLARARAVVCTSREYLDASRALAPWRAKCRVLPLGVDPARLHAPDAETREALRLSWLDGRGEVLAVFAGRLAHYKGLDVLLDAARVMDRRLALVVAGGGELERELARRVEREGLAGRVRLAGRLPDAALHGLMAAADVFCLPSTERSEAFGVVLLEAMALGTPCVSTDIPGSATGSVNLHGQSGLVVPPGDPAALAGALDALAASAELRARLGAQARALFEERYGIEPGAARLLELYAELSGGGASAG